MPPRIDDHVSRSGRIEDDIEDDLQKAGARWRYRIVAGRVRFERDVKQAHRRLRQSIPRYWCPIRHARRVRSPHLLYRNFAEFGDAKGYHRQLPLLRESLKDKDERAT